jgi:hypothetical protein
VVSEPLAYAAPPRPRWVVPVVVAIAVPALALSAVSTWAIWQLPTHPVSSPVAATPKPAAPHGAADTAARAKAEAAILTRRGAAVQAHDEPGFLADLDPANATLRSQQSAIFAGLAKIDFARFSYATNGIDYERPRVAAKYDAPTTIAAVVATHELAGYDTGPVVEAQAVTFVYRQGRWWFASDRDADSSLPAAGHAEPWDSGEARVAKGKHSLVIGESVSQSTLQRVASSVDGAVRADLKFWPAGSGKDRWDGRVVVYVPKAQRDFSSLFAGTTQSADGVVAVTIPVYDNVEFRASGRAYGRITGQRIIINPKYFKPQSSFFETILRHEVSHAAAEPITADGTPSWLVEGLAEYVGWRQPDPAQTFFARGVDRRTANAINARTYRLRLPASSTFYSGSAAAIASRYTTGFLVCAYIQHEYGEGRLKAFAGRMGKATTSAKEPAVLKSALRRTFGLTRTQLEGNVTSWLKQYQIRH